MARIRKIEIRNFRSVRKFDWFPSEGINCLIGPGDSGKSTILDAINFCLGTRRNLQFADSDFYQLDIDTPIEISLTIGELDDSLKNIDTYGVYLRGYFAETNVIEDEPETGAETVLTVKLTVESDLEPNWKLVSERAEVQGLSRNLSWSERVRIAPTRIGAMADYHLGWGRGSVLCRLSEERADISAALAKAARDARAAFGDEAQGQLDETIKTVATTASNLGVPIAGDIKAMLDTHSVSFGSGTISLHDENGVPLRALGIGSTRLLIAGLQRAASDKASIILIDELEYGLEPHRIIRLLDSLGAKEEEPLQVFMTTHSPVVLRELSGNQLIVLRSTDEGHLAILVGDSDDAQGTIRCFPEAFLALSVIACEGASEVGFIRGIDQYRAVQGEQSISAMGVSLVDCNGSNPDRFIDRATVFLSLGYRAGVFCDDDKAPTSKKLDVFVDAGGGFFTWRNGRALEDELFLSLHDEDVDALIDAAIEFHGEKLIDDHIKTETGNEYDLGSLRAEANRLEEYSDELRMILASASKNKSNGWYKSVSKMEVVARNIVGPNLEYADDEFRENVELIFTWIADARE